MLFLLLRVIAFLAALAVAGALAGLLVETEGAVRLSLMGRDYPPLTLAEALAALAAAGAALFLVWKALALGWAAARFLLGDETAFNRYWALARRRRGLAALSRGMVARAEGDAEGADRHARRARRLLGDSGATRLLCAEAAVMRGDEDRARRHFRALAKAPQTGLIGIKGLLAQAARLGERDRAMKLAAHAFDLRPRDPSVQRALFDLQIRNADWAGAARTLEAMRRAGATPPEVASRRAAVIALERARAAFEAGDRDEARRFAEEAAAAAIDLAPAVAFAARRRAEAGDAGRAARLLREAWRSQPQPALAEAYAALAPEESPAARRRRFQPLIEAYPGHPETRLLAAELALADHDAEGARRALGDLAETAPTHRSLAVMAAAQRAAGAPERVVRGYLARAVAAPRGPHWVCGRCAAGPGAWSAVCPRCGAFDSLDWRDDRSVAFEAIDDAMLPLLVEAGRPEAEGPDSPADDASAARRPEPAASGA